MHKALTLYELNQLVRETIEIEMPDEYWVEAELSDIHERGHCYMDLIEKDEDSNTPIAKARANSWMSRWQIIKSNFERVTGQSLHPGMKLMLKVKATFHEAYGFAWNVTDIDPTFTLGDMAKKRQEIICRLKDEGVFDLQRELQIPMFAQRIAVISSQSAAGYGDFCNQLFDNDYGFVFQTKLFPAVMQGEQVEQSIIAALNDINEEMESFDVVVIIRGGGATADLSGFDTLALAENVANFPLPVITGIGHERDESILDMISNTRVKTPTAAAAFLINHLADVYTRIEEAKQSLLNLVGRNLEYEKMRMARLSEKIPSLFKVFKAQQISRLDNLFLTSTSLASKMLESKKFLFTSQTTAFYAAASHFLDERKHHVALLEEKLKALDPQRMLSRGYSITLYKGHSVQDASILKAGDEIETRVKKGTIKSIIK